MDIVKDIVVCYFYLIKQEIKSKYLGFQQELLIILQIDRQIDRDNERWLGRILREKKVREINGEREKRKKLREINGDIL